MIALLLFVVPGVAAIAAGIDANRRDGDWAFPWQGSLLALGCAQVGLVIGSIASRGNPLVVLLAVLLTLAAVPVVVLYAMQADNHPRQRKPFQPDRFPTGRG